MEINQMIREFRASLLSYADMNGEGTLEGDNREQIALAMADLSVKELVLTEPHDLAAIFSSVVAVKQTEAMTAINLDKGKCLWVKAGHPVAGMFKRLLTGDETGREILDKIWRCIN